MAKGYPKLRVAKAVYDFATDGGAATTISISDSPTIPDNAIIMRVTTLCTTAMTSGGSATVAVACGGLTVISAQNFNHASVADEKVTVNDVADKTTSATVVQFVVATAALTAGVVEIYVEYIISPESA